MARSFKVRRVRGLKMGTRASPLMTGGGAESYADGNPPDGYRWVFVTDSGARVTSKGSPVVELEEIT